MTIYARQNDDGSWRLWVNSHGMDSPAGTRLDRGALFPQETLHDHENEAEVKISAAKLQKYIDEREMALWANRKRKNKWK